MSDIALHFAGVGKRYGNVPALAGFSLDVQRGESFALVGVNGAGKTTLIKCLLDFCEVDEGAIGIFAELRRGRLRPGYQADVIILDRDPLACPVPEIRGTRVLATIIDGEPVFSR